MILHLARRFPGTLLAVSGFLAAGLCLPAAAATVCVDPAGASGCVKTIGAAVTAATTGDTIQVAAGTYKEAVSITKPLSLIGAGSASTIIDATGQPHGIAIDGSGSAPNTAFNGVVVSGFSVENANFSGILAQNVSGVTIWNNQVLGNDKSLNTTAAGGCPGLPPAFASGEADDCGEGIHLSGVQNSVVSNNVVRNNAGGILVSDDTGTTRDNVITGNLVSDNHADCGITLASHSNMGVIHNTVSGNTSMNNGTAGTGGAGIGIFAAGPGNNASGNVIINNQLTGNGHPGVTMHNHAAPPGAPAANLDNNIISGNTISGNGADTEDATTPGTAGIDIYSLVPVNGVVVTQNIVSQEDIGLAVKAPGSIAVLLNNFAAPTGINNLGAGTVNGTQNFFGCAAGPGSAGCGNTSGAVTSTPSLVSAFGGGQLPGAPGTTPPPPAGTTGVTIMVAGPNGATSTNNSFQTTSNQFTLNASQSTSSNPGTLTYLWTPSPGYPTASIVGGNTATPTFQIGSRGIYQFTLKVTDPTGASSTAKITVQYN